MNNAPWGLTQQELRVFRRLNTPEKIQDFLEKRLRYNSERNGETCRSPREVLRHGEAHCMEGALFAAAALRVNGYRPLLVDLTATRDHDHVICVFRRSGRWGALSKSKFNSLGYRNPIYRSIRELALSYFPFYNNYRGTRTLRSYTQPMHLGRFDSMNWMTSGEDLWDIGMALIERKHHDLVPRGLKLRPVTRDMLYADLVRAPTRWKSAAPKKGF